MCSITIYVLFVGKYEALEACLEYRLNHVISYLWVVKKKIELSKRNTSMNVYGKTW